MLVVFKVKLATESDFFAFEQLKAAATTKEREECLCWRKEEFFCFRFFVKPTTFIAERLFCVCDVVVSEIRFFITLPKRKRKL